MRAIWRRSKNKRAPAVFAVVRRFNRLITANPNRPEKYQIHTLFQINEIHIFVMNQVMILVLCFGDGQSGNYHILNT